MPLIPVYLRQRPKSSVTQSEDNGGYLAPRPRLSMHSSAVSVPHYEEVPDGIWSQPSSSVSSSSASSPSTRSNRLLVQHRADKNDNRGKIYKTEATISLVTNRNLDENITTSL